MIENHYGCGLRNDEKPYAHKIPPGGNWKALPLEDQKAFLKGSYGNGGGNTYQLRRMAWTEAAATITTAIMGKATCQLHPGRKPWESEEMHYDKTPQLEKNGLSAVEFFAGGGLMAAGVTRAGWNTVWANDFEKAATVAYAHNIGDHIRLGDVTAIPLDEIPYADAYFGGPPCQDFSVAGEGHGEDGDRGKLVYTYRDIIAAKQPKAFLFENVKGLLTKKHRPTFDKLLQLFEEAGYTVNWKLINSWDYGVAQKRERVFIVGIRNDLGFSFQFPEPREGDYRTQMLRDAIGDLPEPDQVKPEKPYGKNPSGSDRHPLSSMDRPAHTIVATQTGGKNAFYPEEVAAAAETPENHDPKPLSAHVTEKMTEGGYAVYIKKHPLGEMDSPSSAVLTQWAKGAPNGLVITNNKPRRFTVRECLRIQSVPDSYVLPSTLSLSAQYKIVGNGVPSRLAYILSAALAEQMKDAENLKRQGKPMISQETIDEVIAHFLQGTDIDEIAAVTKLTEETVTDIIRAALNAMREEAHEHPRSRYFDEINAERDRQNRKHPMPAGFPKSDRLAILIEEVGEVGKAICEHNPVEARTELIQVAATALRWVEEKDREAIAGIQFLREAGISPEPEEIEAYRIATGHTIHD